MSHTSPVLARFPNVLIPFRHVNLSVPQKITVVTLTVGVALLGFLARYLRRRRRTTNPSVKKLGMSSPSGDALSQASSNRRSTSPSVRSLHRQASVLSERLLALPGDQGVLREGLSPQQLGVMGMEALETAINYWDDALAAYTSVSVGPLAVTTGDEAQFCEDLQRLVDQAYELQEQCELLFLDQRSVLFRTNSSNRMYSELHSAVTSSAESFVSAQDEVADLREFEEFAEFFPDVENLPLYQAAKAHFESGGAIPYRTLRTEMVRCSSDIEFICKLHCIRLALTAMFREKANWHWLADTGRQILTDILIYGDKDPKDLLIAYEDMLSFLQNEDNWPQMEQELSLKGVKAMTLYDILLDYIIMDAFDDLDMPPSSVTAVVQNRWLSNGFKETALTTAVWSLFKAKRRMLRFADGFISHFYAISEQISPMMAWGFLGPDEGLKDICHFFRDQVTGLLVDMFSFQKCRYSTLQELSQDILQLMKNRADGIGHKLKTNLCDVVQ